MATSKYSWSLTAGNNGNADTNINWQNGQLAPTLNDSARAMMAAERAWINAVGGAITYAGSSNAYTATNNTPGLWSSYVAGQIIALKANHTNNGAATINVDGLGAKAIKTCDGGDVLSGDIVSGGIYLLAYDGTNFQILNTIGTGGPFQPLDADLTAIAALGYTSGDYLIKKTAADTWALVNEASYAHLAGTETFTGAKTFSGGLAVSAGSFVLQNSFYPSVASPQIYQYPHETGGWTISTNRQSAGNERYFSFNAAGTLTIGGSLVYTAANLPGTAITWTAAQTFTSLSVFSGNGSAAQHRFIEPAAGTNEKNWQAYPLSAAMVFACAADDFSTNTSWLTVTRSGSTPALAAFGAPVQAAVAVSSETSGTLTSASRNKQVNCSGGVTLPNSVFTANDKIVFDPGASARTFTRGSGIAMYVNGSDVSSATLAANQMGGAHWRSASAVVLSGGFS